jgi:hypothetical protein
LSHFEVIFREIEAFGGPFLKIAIIFEDFFREIEAYLKIARLFKYIFPVRP